MPNSWGRRQTRCRWTSLLEIVRASHLFPTPNRGGISLPGLHPVRAGTLAVTGGGMRCGRMVRPSVWYSVPGFIDSNPELFRRPLHQPVNVRIPLLHDLRESGLLLPTLVRPVYTSLGTSIVLLIRRRGECALISKGSGKKLLIAQNGVLKRPEASNEGLRIPARTVERGMRGEASRLASCHYTGA
jgi:hypothetical protein